MPDVCLVVPCFNEAARLPAAAFLAYLHQDPQVAYCFVDDGSRDATAAVLEQLRATAPDRITVVSLSVNSGKAEAVRQGMMRCFDTGRFTAIGYWDADLATPLREVMPMRDLLLRHPDCQLIIGSRWRHLGAVIERNEMRHVLGRVFATAASWLLRQPLYDSQCGAKLFRASAVGSLFSEQFLTRWLFDVELLARLHHLSDNSSVAAIERPLDEWRDVGGSRLSLAHMLMVPRDLWRIHRRYRIR